MIKNYKLLSIGLLAFLAGFTLLSFTNKTHTKVEYKQITVIESIVPGGLGRSRIVEEKNPLDAAKFTTERSSGKDSKQGSIKRSKAKINKFEETKLLNFYSLAGINFQNIASNDALIMSKVNGLVSEGWDLAFVNSGVESEAGDGDGKGIYVTRYIFKRNN